MQDVYADLAVEGAEIGDLVSELSPEEWATETPAASWTVRHQVAHLAYVSRMVRLAVSDADAFEAEIAPVREDFQSG
ncbi:wyosine base formation domain-containing protein, partial [Streptomyces sp. SID11233]|nr:wyosine base formation domain-containing protein [Streptomyces sp. SID11233]